MRYPTKCKRSSCCRNGHAGTSTFFRWPILGALLFDNESSDARDHCANERSTAIKMLIKRRNEFFM